MEVKCINTILTEEEEAFVDKTLPILSVLLKLKCSKQEIRYHKKQGEKLELEVNFEVDETDPIRVLDSLEKAFKGLGKNISYQPEEHRYMLQFNLETEGYDFLYIPIKYR